MLAVIRVSRGPHVGASRALMPGQRALIGCGNWSHFPVEDASIGDPQLLVKNSRSGITVENISQSAILFVNGLRSVSRKLSNGDVIGVGDSELIVEIRGEPGHLDHLNLPLVGSIQMSQGFGQSVRLSQAPERRGGDRHTTIHPDFWTDSLRLRNRGSGSPSLKMLQNISRKRRCGLIVNQSIVSDLRQIEGISEECLVPILSGKVKEPLLFILDSVPLNILHDVVTRWWTSKDTLFFVPVDSSRTYREHFSNSTLWTNRTVEQLTTLLMAGSIAIRESAFRFLDALLLPVSVPEEGWILLSTVRVDTSAGNESAKPA